MCTFAIKSIEMKRADFTKLLIVSTFVALGVLVYIQVSWTLKAARLEEQNFNHRVVMALKDARDEIGRRVPKCNHMSDFLCGRKCAIRAAKEMEIDSIIQSNLGFYDINIPYSFEVTDTIRIRQSSALFAPKCYQQSLNGLLERNGINIRLQFPDRNRFLLTQMQGLFLTSMLFIIFVFISYIILLRQYKLDKRLMTQTKTFINNMVHEFQTPLANIRFATNLIKKKTKDDGGEKIKAYTDVLTSECERMQKHTEDILFMSCDLNNGDKESIDVHAMIQEVAQSFAVRIQEGDGNFDFHLSAKSSYIVGNRSELAIVLSNLIDNAIKYSSGSPSIEFSTQNEKDRLIVKIKDQGIGIAKEDLGQVFSQYFRVNTGDVHNVKGFGLGLAFVKKVIERWSGSISVKSKLGEGTVFTIELPTHDGKEE
jgi:two-component system phosphate regulon sensor histidine kinase PhoR